MKMIYYMIKWQQIIVHLIYVVEYRINGEI